MRALFGFCRLVVAGAGFFFVWLLVSSSTLAQEKGVLVITPFGELGVPGAVIKQQENQKRVKQISVSKEAVRTELVAGRYSVNLGFPILTPIRNVEIQAGQEAKLDLVKLLGKLRLVPTKGAGFGWKYVYDANGKEITHFDEDHDFYCLEAGSYSIDLGWPYLSHLSFEVKAGEETLLDTSKRLGRVRPVPTEGAAFGWKYIYNADGKRIASFDEDHDFYCLEPGSYSVDLGWPYLSRVSFEINAGEETVLDTSKRLGRVRPVPTEGAAFGWKYIYNADGKRIASFDEDHDFYCLEPGSYSVTFGPAYLMPIRFAVAAGKENVLDFQEALGRLDFEPVDGAQPGNFDILDADLGVKLAGVNDSHGPFYGVLPGRYRIRFRNRDLPEVKVVVAAGKRTHVIPGETEAFPEGFNAQQRLPVRTQAGDTIVELTWNPPEGLKVSGYRVYLTGSARPIHGPRLLASPRFLNIGLTNGRMYTYVVRAVLPDGGEWKDYQPRSATPGVPTPATRQ